MILNNLDADVAQFPHELVTYGGNGQVFANWIQFRVTLRYLAEMDEQQTLAMYSGHPLGQLVKSIKLTDQFNNGNYECFSHHFTHVFSHICLQDCFHRMWMRPEW